MQHGEYVLANDHVLIPNETLSNYATFEVTFIKKTFHLMITFCADFPVNFSPKFKSRFVMCEEVCVPLDVFIN